MLVDLVQVTTVDGVRLHGALQQPDDAGGEASSRTTPIDAWLCIHGTGSNFYSASTLAGIAPGLLATGAAVLRVNTRGHDLLCTGPSAGGRALLGAALERVDEAPRDLAAWIEWLTERGYRRIGLLGHSMGAIKSILTLAGDDPPGVAALIAISPPRLSYSHFLEGRGADEFRRTFQRAGELVRDHRGDELMLINFPLPYYVSAAGFVDRYGPEEKYNVLRLLARVAQPMLVVYGSLELQSGAAFMGMSEAVVEHFGASNSSQVAVIAGADHVYTGCHDALASRIAHWVSRLAGSGPRRR